MKPNHFLRRERELRGWSQARLAELVGADTTTVRRWERGISSPYPHFREKLCTLFEKNAQTLGLVIDEANSQRENLFTLVPHRPEPIFDPTIPPATALPLAGRIPLLYALKERLCDVRNNKTLALHGLPGIGKTALATHLAHDEQIHTCFPDGVLWASLGPHPAIATHFSHWGKLVGISSEEIPNMRSDVDWARALRIAIGDRRILLVIDDAWQSESALALKVGGPQCATLLTTRFPQIALLFAEANTIAVPELSTSEGLGLLARYVPEIDIREPEVAKALVQAVGGLPLALTLMGKHLQIQGYGGQIRRWRAAANRLMDAQERLHLAFPYAPLEQPSVLASETPLSLQAVIAVSIQPLAEKLQRALFAISIFPARPHSFSEEAALVVSDVTHEVLDQLTDTGLLESQRPDRYLLHQTIIDYARTHMQQELAPKIRLISYYSEYVEKHAQNEAALELEHQNILVTLETAYELDIQPQLIKGVIAFVPHLQQKGLYTLADLHLKRAFLMAEKLQNTLALATIRQQQGEGALLQGRHAQAETYVQEGLDLARKINDPERISALLVVLGSLLRQKRIFFQAENVLLESLDLARQSNRIQHTIEILRQLGINAMEQKNTFQAEEYLQKGLALAQQLDKQDDVIRLLINLGMVAADQQDTQQAEAYYLQAITCAQQNGNRQLMAFLFGNLGLLSGQQGDFIKAERYFQYGLDWAQENAQQKCLLLINLAKAVLERHRYQQAEAYCQEGLALAGQLELHQISCLLLKTLGMVLTRQGKYTQAEQYFQKALVQAREIDTFGLIDIIFYEIGEMYLLSERFDEASNIFARLLTTLAKGNQNFEAVLQYKLARVTAGKGNIAEAQLLGTMSLRVLEKNPILGTEITHWLASLSVSQEA